MPIKSLEDLPKAIKDSLPKHGQDIWMKAYNSAYEEYKNASDRRDDETREGTAARVAWAAVKHEYKRVKEGDWVKK